MININLGEVISVRHYSGISPFKSIVLSLSEEFVEVKLTKEFAVMNFLEGDPVVFGYEIGEQVFIYGCNIESIRPKEDILILKVDKVDEGANQRKFERYPVSLYADIRTKECRKKNLAIVKDISYYGMLLYSKADLNVGDDLEIDIYMDKSIVFLKANLIRKSQTEHYNEYGVGIVYEDSNSINQMKDYIRRLKDEQEQAVRKMKK